MSPVARAWSLAAVLALLALVSQRMERSIPPQPWVSHLAELPLSAEAEEVEEISLDESSRRVLGVDDYRFLELLEPGARPLWLFVGYYAGQHGNSQIHAPEHCYPGMGYRVVESRGIDVSGRPLRELIVEREGDRRLVWYGFRTRLGTPGDPWRLKFHQMGAALAGRDRDALLLRLSTPFEDGGESQSVARQRLRSLWVQAGDDVESWYVDRGPS